MSNLKPRPDDHTHHCGPSVGRRLGLVIFVLFLTGVVGYLLVERLYAQVLYEWAGSDLKIRQPAKAVARLDKAIAFEPRDPVLWMRLGDAHHLLATMQPVEDGITNVRKAQTAFATAFDLNPLDAEAAYRLAMEASLEEKVSVDLFEEPPDAPYHARQYFKTAIQLRPGSVQYYHTYSRYLNAIEDSAELIRVVERMVYLYPRAINWLKKELLWTTSLRSAAKRGLGNALLEGRATDTAKRMMVVVDDIPEPDHHSGGK